MDKHLDILGKRLAQLACSVHAVYRAQFSRPETNITLRPFVSLDHDRTSSLREMGGSKPTSGRVKSLIRQATIALLYRMYCRPTTVNQVTAWQRHSTKTPAQKTTPPKHKRCCVTDNRHAPCVICDASIRISHRFQAHTVGIRSTTRGDERKAGNTASLHPTQFISIQSPLFSTALL